MKLTNNIKYDIISYYKYIHKIKKPKMRTFSVSERGVEEGIRVENNDLFPFWKFFMVHKSRPYWIGVSCKDLGIVTDIETKYFEIEERVKLSLESSTGFIKKADLITLKKKPGHFLFIKERRKSDNFLVFWTINSGKNGGVKITSTGSIIKKYIETKEGTDKMSGRTIYVLAEIIPGGGMEADITGHDAPSFRFIRHNGEELVSGKNISINGRYFHR